MIGILGERIKDQRFLRLIRKFLKAGYLEDWQYHKTYSGTPQGGIISPILANIYLDKLDCFMAKLKKEFDLGKRRKTTSKANYYAGAMTKLRKRLSAAESAEEREHLQKEIRKVELERQKYPNGDPFDHNFKRLQYTRYADDFLVGVIGGKEDALKIKAQIKEFVFSALRLELSEEKTLITNSEKRAGFCTAQSAWKCLWKLCGKSCWNIMP